MIKWTTFATVSDDGVPFIRVLNNDLEKTAEYRPDLQEFLGTFEKKANHTYVLVNAMTSGEFFGPNLNGDYFPEGQLNTYHKTFEKHAYAYRHHVNKDPQKSAGKVIFSTMNPDMHRVELIIELDNSKAQDILERMNKGEFPAVSMGTRTPSDRCSICNNRAKNTAAYCDHLKYQMRHTMPDGRRVYAVNDDRLTFFDISFVRVPADRTASVLSKVAHVQDEETTTVISSAAIGEEWVKRSGIKEADLFKEVPGSIEGMSPDPKGLIIGSTMKFPRETIDKIASEFTLSEILSTLLGLRIMPQADEFARIVCMSSKQPNLIERANQALEHEQHLLDLGEDPRIPMDVSLKGFNQELANILQMYVPGMSLTKPLIIKRAMLKRAAIAEGDPTLATNLRDPLFTKSLKGPQPTTYSPVKNPILPLAGLGALYYGYQKLFKDASELPPFLAEKKNWWMLPLFLGATALATTTAQKNMFKKEASFIGLGDKAFPLRMAVAVPASYVAAGHFENKLQKGEQINEVQDLVRKHPFLTSVGALAGANYLTKKIPVLKKLGSFDRIMLGLSPEKFEELYNDVVGIN